MGAEGRVRRPQGHSSEHLPAGPSRPAAGWGGRGAVPPLPGSLSPWPREWPPPCRRTVDGPSGWAPAGFSIVLRTLPGAPGVRAAFLGRGHLAVEPLGHKTGTFAFCEGRLTPARRRGRVPTPSSTGLRPPHGLTTRRPRHSLHGLAVASVHSNSGHRGPCPCCHLAPPRAVTQPMPSSVFCWFLSGLPFLLTGRPFRLYIRIQDASEAQRFAPAGHLCVSSASR